MTRLLKLPFLILWRILTLGAGWGEIRRTADRIARYADRFANAGRRDLADLTHGYADRAGMCFFAAGARGVEEEFLVRIGAKRPRPRPVSGRDDDRDRTSNSGLPAAGWAGGSASSGDSSASDPSTYSGGGGEFGGAGASGSWDAPADGTGSEGAAPSGGAGGSYTDNS